MTSHQVSIILTCYKQERYIEDTILSVINQGYKNRELLIGDDSPDRDCWDIISRYVKKYPQKIRAWHHNPNKGIVNNMIFLIKQRNKKSGFIAFLEGDDCLFPEYLQKKLDIFMKYPNIQLIYNELTTINENGGIIEKEYLRGHVKCFYHGGKMTYDKLVSEAIYASRSTLMIKSNMVDKYCLINECLGSQTIISDIYFFNQIAHNEDIFGIKIPLTYYRIHKNSVTKNIKGDTIFCFEFINYINYLFKQGLITDNTYKNQLVRRYLIIAIQSIKQAIHISVFSTFKWFLKDGGKAIINKFKKFIQ